MKKPPDDWGQVCESAGTDLVQPEEAAEGIANDRQDQATALLNFHQPACWLLMEASDHARHRVNNLTVEAFHWRHAVDPHSLANIQSLLTANGGDAVDRASGGLHV